MDNVCAICGKPKGRNKYCCSMKCFAEYKKNWKTCVVCGKIFQDPQCSPTKCCSKECSKINRQKLMASGAYDKNFEKMIEGKNEFAKTHKGKDHIGAKYWEIESPDGERYQFVNLNHFIKKNLSLFKGTRRQVYDGFQKIKASELGKRKYKSYTYKGWKLIKWTNNKCEVCGKNLKSNPGKEICFSCQKWEEWYKEATEYRNKWGNLTICKEQGTDNATGLGSWIRVQQKQYRKGELSKYRIEKMELLGIVWTEQDRHTWSEWFEMAKRYYEEFGDLEIRCDYTTKSGENLGNWIVVQRQKYNNKFRGQRLTDDEIEKLNSIGMQWRSNRPENTWNNWYEIAMEYRREFGDLKVSLDYTTDNGEKLGIWIRDQRQKHNTPTPTNRLTLEQIEKLEEIGMVWNMVDKKREEWYEAVQIYRETFGDLKVDRTYVTPEGKKLGLWINQKRAKYKKGKLTDEQIKKLEDMGMIWDIKKQKTD